MFRDLPDPKRLVGYSKFATSHYAAEGALYLTSINSARSHGNSALINR